MPVMVLWSEHYTALAKNLPLGIERRCAAGFQLHYLDCGHAIPKDA
jgi:hypothetical protein